MKRVMKFVKQNMIGFILGIMITGIGVVTAATLVPATGVSYGNSSSNVTNVNEALDELFSMSSKGGGNFTLVLGIQYRLSIHNFNDSNNGKVLNGTWTIKCVDGVITTSFPLSAGLYFNNPGSQTAQNGSFNFTITSATLTFDN